MGRGGGRGTAGPGCGVLWGSAWLRLCSDPFPSGPAAAAAPSTPSDVASEWFLIKTSRRSAVSWLSGDDHRFHPPPLVFLSAQREARR